MSLRKLFFPLGILLFLFPACTEKESDLGVDLQDPFSLYSGIRDTAYMTGCTIYDDSLWTAGYQYGIFGDYEDDVFVVLQSYIDRMEYEAILRNIRRYDEKLADSQKTTADKVLLVASAGLFFVSAVYLAGSLIASYSMLSTVTMANTRLVTMNLLSFNNGNITKGSVLQECAGILTYCKMVLSHRDDRKEALNKIIDYMESSSEEYKGDIAHMKTIETKDKDKKLIKIAETNLRFFEQTIKEIKKMK